jgi:hypothetical protein
VPVVALAHIRRSTCVQSVGSRTCHVQQRSTVLKLAHTSMKNINRQVSALSLQPMPSKRRDWGSLKRASLCASTLSRQAKDAELQPAYENHPCTVKSRSSITAVDFNESMTSDGLQGGIVTEEHHGETEHCKAGCLPEVLRQCCEFLEDRRSRFVAQVITSCGWYSACSGTSAGKAVACDGNPCLLGDP